GRRRSGYRILGIRPPGARQIVQRDAHAPPVRRRPYEDNAEQSDRGQSDDEVPPDETEIDDDDDRGDRETIADGGEGPGVAGIAFVDEAADAAAFQVRRETGKEGALTAVRAPLVPAAADGRDRRGRSTRSRQTGYLMRTRVPLI